MKLNTIKKNALHSCVCVNESTMAFLSHEEKQLEILVSSDPRAGAVVTESGSRMEIRFDEPMTIPREASNVELQVAGVNIWRTTPNVRAGINDRLEVFVDNVSVDTTIPEGNYDLDSLNQAIAVALNQLPLLGYISPALVEQTIEFVEDLATERVVLNITTDTNFTITFGPGSFGALLGFDDGEYGPPVILPPPGNTRFYTKEGQNRMNMTVIEYYLVHTDLVPRGLRVNGGFFQVAAQVLVEGGIGKQQVYAPTNPPKCRAQYLAGNSIDRITVWLTDHNNLPISTGGEPFVVRFIITYQVPIKA